MNEMPNLLTLASSAARHAATRQATIAANVANADTPGFRARDIGSFSPDMSDIVLRRTQPGHLMGGAGHASSFEISDAPADPNGNNVNLEDQVLRSIDAARAHDRAVTVYRSALDMIRSSLGRR